MTRRSKRRMTEAKPRSGFRRPDDGSVAPLDACPDCRMMTLLRDEWTEGTGYRASYACLLCRTGWTTWWSADAPGRLPLAQQRALRDELRPEWLSRALGFEKYIRGQSDRDDEVGDLARDLRSDPEFWRGRYLSPSGLIEQLRKRGASDDALRAAAYALEEFDEIRGSPSIPNSIKGDEMQRYVRFYQDGGSLAISTNVVDESEFNMLAAQALADFADTKTNRVASLRAALPLIEDLVCKLRGYKAPMVEEHRVLTAGKLPPRDSLLVAAGEDERPAEMADRDRRESVV